MIISIIAKYSVGCKVKSPLEGRVFEQAQQLELFTIKRPSVGIPLQNPCPRCRGEQGAIGAGKKPGQGSLICANCGQFLQWASQRQLKALSAKRGES